MEEKMLNLIFKESEAQFDMHQYETILKEELNKEIAYLNDGKLIKVCDFEDNDDGIYLSINNGYIINIVQDSFKRMKTIEENDFYLLLAYSYIVRILSMIQNPLFYMIREFTMKMDSIIKKYL